MNAFDLFSCVGGHSLGLHRAGIETVAFCEFDAWRRDVIARHFPGVPIYDDVHTAPAVRADIYVGGPPCQGTSVAAAIQGSRDGRTLWPEMYRLVREGDPRWVVVEQPPGNAEWESEVSRCLASSGYFVSWADFEASSFGLLCHRRRRYAVACRSEPRLAIARRSIASQIAAGQRLAAHRDVGRVRVPGDLRVGDGFSDRMDGITAQGSERVRRIEAIGDSNPPIMMQVVGLGLVEAER